MQFTQRQIEIARRLSLGASFFQNVHMNDPLMKEQFEDSYKSLQCFIENYAYQRQGAPIKAYAHIGKMTIKRIFNGDIRLVTHANVQEIWKKYQEIAEKEFNGLKVNKRNNPLSPNGGVLSLLASGRVTNNNLAVHVKYLLENGKTINAHELIDNIRGIGEKIAPLYLRDIAHLGRIPRAK